MIFHLFILLQVVLSQNSMYESMPLEMKELIDSHARGVDQPSETFEEFVWRKQQYCSFMFNTLKKETLFQKARHECKILGKRLDLINRWKIRGEFDKIRAIREGIFSLQAYKVTNMRQHFFEQYSQLQYDIQAEEVVQQLNLLCNYDSIDISVVSELASYRQDLHIILMKLPQIQLTMYPTKKDCLIVLQDDQWFDKYYNALIQAQMKLGIVVIYEVAQSVSLSFTTGREYPNCDASNIKFKDQTDQEKFAHIGSQAAYWDIAIANSFYSSDQLKTATTIASLVIPIISGSTPVRQFSLQFYEDLIENDLKALEIIKNNQIVDSRTVFQLMNFQSNHLARWMNENYISGLFKHTVNAADDVSARVRNDAQLLQVIEQIKKVGVSSTVLYLKVSQLNILSGELIGLMNKLLSSLTRPTTKVIIQMHLEKVIIVEQGQMDSLWQEFQKSHIEVFEVRSLFQSTVTLKFNKKGRSIVNPEKLRIVPGSLKQGSK